MKDSSEIDQTPQIEDVVMEQTFIPPKVKKKKNYMEHEYLLERKSFRLMRKFYV